MKMKKGFTLAEVLITLGIIGVVAAMTIPTLIQNYREREFEAKIKKSYSTLAQAFQELIRRQNALYISDTTFVDHPVQALSTVMAVSDSPVGSYTISGGGYMYSNSVDSVVLLADGTILGIEKPKSSNSKNAIVTQLLVDTNGEKAPNTYGRDVFVFYLRNDGRVIAGTQNGSFRSFGNGASETQRIMQRGWQIGD